jgi:hypothetical protein
MAEENYLGPDYVYHAVRDDADVASIVKNGLRTGSNIVWIRAASRSREVETILVFRRADLPPL